MTIDEWNVLIAKYAEAWEHLANTIQRVGGALTKIFRSINNKEKSEVKENKPFIPHCKKNRHIKDYAPMYRVERRIQKHLPYQRRNY